MRAIFAIAVMESYYARERGCERKRRENTGFDTCVLSCQSRFRDDTHIFRGISKDSISPVENYLNFLFFFFVISYTYVNNTDSLMYEC